MSKLFPAFFGPLIFLENRIKATNEKAYGIINNKSLLTLGIDCLDIPSKIANTNEAIEIRGILQAPVIIIASAKKPNPSTSPMNETFGLLYINIAPAKPARQEDIINPFH
ncbi:MAG: hypothetical protein RSD09_00260 [Bacilli bacterium]